MSSALLLPALRCAARAPTPGRVSSVQGVLLTAEDGVYRHEVGADGHDDHGEGEGEQLDDDVRGHGGGDAGPLVCCRAGADGVVVLVEDGLLGGDDPLGGHLGRGWGLGSGKREMVGETR